eukprot:1158478-Pelagomonas_calceolata.AAC.8
MDLANPTNGQAECWWSATRMPGAMRPMCVIAPVVLLKGLNARENCCALCCRAIRGFVVLSGDPAYLSSTSFLFKGANERLACR